MSDISRTIRFQVTTRSTRAIPSGKICCSSTNSSTVIRVVAAAPGEKRWGGGTEQFSESGKSVLSRPCQDFRSFEPEQVQQSNGQTGVALFRPWHFLFLTSVFTFSPP